MLEGILTFYIVLLIGAAIYWTGYFIFYHIPKNIILFFVQAFNFFKELVAEAKAKHYARVLRKLLPVIIGFIASVIVYIILR